MTFRTGIAVCATSAALWAADLQTLPGVIEAFDKGGEPPEKQALASAVSAFSSTIRLNPKDAQAFCGRGIARLYQGDNDKAIADFNDCLWLDPRSARALCGRAEACLGKNCFHKAIADASEAICLDPKRAPSYGARAYAYWQIGDLKTSIRDFSMAIQGTPKVAWLYLDRAMLCEETRDFDQALADYSEVIRLEPDDYDTMARRGKLYQDRGDFDKAIRDYTEVVRLHPDGDDGYRQRGDAYVLRGDKLGAKADLARAIADYSKAIQLLSRDTKPDSSAADLWRGRMMEKRGVAFAKAGAIAEAKADFAAAKKLGWPHVDQAKQAPHAKADLGKRRPSAAESPSRRPDGSSLVFGPAFLGLGPDDEMRIDFGSLGCFHHVDGTLVFAGCSPESASIEETGQPIPLNANDWRRLRRTLCSYRLGHSNVRSTTEDRAVVSWFVNHRWVRRESFADASSKGRLLNELLYRATSDDRPQGGDKAPVSRSYPVGDLASCATNAPGKAAPDVTSLAGLIYGIVQPRSWTPGEGCEIRVSRSGDPPVLTISQTADGHEEIARLLGFLRRVARDAGKAPRDEFRDETEQGRLRAFPVDDLLGSSAQPGRAVPEELVELVAGRCEPMNSSFDGTEMLSFNNRHFLVAGESPGEGRGIGRELSCLRAIARNATAGSEVPVVVHLHDPGFENFKEMAYLAPVGNCEALRRVIIAAVRPADWIHRSGVNGSASCVTLGKTNAVIVDHVEEVHAEIAELLQFLQGIARDSAAGRAAARYDWDLAIESVQSPVSKKLSRRVTLDFDRQPIGEVLSAIRSSYGLDSKLDDEMRRFLAAKPDAAVTIHVKNASLRSAMRQLLRCLDLGWSSEWETLTLTKREDADSTASVAFYPVGDLLAGKNAPSSNDNGLDALVETIVSGIASGDWGSPDGLDALNPTLISGNPSREWHSPDGSTKICGLTFGGAGLIEVARSDDIQDRVAALLAKIRAARNQCGRTESPIESERGRS